MDPALLDDHGRAELLDFYGDVFGWTEGDNTGEVGNPLILYTGAFGAVRVPPARRSVSAGAGDGPLRSAGRDASPELEAIVDRAKARQASDERVTIIDVHARTTQGPHPRLHAHERVHRLRDPPPRRAPTPRTPREGRLGRSRPLVHSRRGAHRHSRGAGRRRGDGVVAAARDGRHGRPHDHHRVPAQQAPRDRARGRRGCASRSSTTAPRARRSGPRRSSKRASPRSTTTTSRSTATYPGYSDRQRLAIEYAERFAADHRNIDDELFTRLRAHFADDEILDLTLCCAVFVGLGRTLEVLQITDNCPIDL